MNGWVVVLAFICLLNGCDRETRDFRTDPPIAGALGDVAVMPGEAAGAPPHITMTLGDPYETNAYQLSQGKQLYTWFNCKGCHANGGGASGPALTDGWWRYGPDKVSVFVSIRDGRPHGMPAFHRHLTNEQIWQLTGYIRTMGAVSAKTAAPSRNDEMHSRPAESRGPATAPLTIPPSH